VSLRTMKTIWLFPPVSVRVEESKINSDVALEGTCHEAETAQFPQSARFVVESVKHAGLV